MATSSIFSNITVRDKAFCRSLIHALEHSKKDKGKQVILSKCVTELDQEQIRNLFTEEK